MPRTEAAGALKGTGEFRLSRNADGKRGAKATRPHGRVQRMAVSSQDAGRSRAFVLALHTRLWVSRCPSESLFGWKSKAPPPRSKERQRRPGASGGRFKRWLGIRGALDRLSINDDNVVFGPAG